MSTKTIQFIEVPRRARVYSDREPIRRSTRRPVQDYSRRDDNRFEYRQPQKRSTESTGQSRSTTRRPVAKKKKSTPLSRSTIFLALELFILLIVATATFNILTKSESSPLTIEEVKKDDPKWLKKAKTVEMPSWVDVQLINSEKEGNPSRTGQTLEGINDIVVHYVGNPRTTAQQNRDYYNNPESDVCSHFVVGLDGEIINCVPLYEKSASSNDRNRDTISIEVCHPDVTGEFTDDSYQSLIKLVNWLMDEFDLDKEHVIRHYEVTGKECPMYYVRNPEAWDKFKEDLD